MAEQICILDQGEVNNSFGILFKNQNMGIDTILCQFCAQLSAILRVAPHIFGIFAKK